MLSHVRAASCLLKTPMSKSLGILAFMAGDHKTFSREQARRKHEKAEKEIEKEIRRRPVQAEMGRIVEKKLSTKKGQFKLQLYPFRPRQQAHANVNAREREKSRSKSKSKSHSSHHHHSSHSRPSEHAAWKQHPPDRPHKSSGRDADRGRYRTRHHAESASDLASVLSSIHLSDEDYEGHDGSYYDDDGDAHEEYPHAPHTPPQGPAPDFPPPPPGIHAGHPPQHYSQQPSSNGQFVFPPQSQARPPPMGPPMQPGAGPGIRQPMGQPMGQSPMGSPPMGMAASQFMPGSMPPPPPPPLPPPSPGMTGPMGGPQFGGLVRTTDGHGNASGSSIPGTIARNTSYDTTRSNGIHAACIGRVGRI